MLTCHSAETLKTKLELLWLHVVKNNFIAESEACTKILFYTTR